MPLPIHEIVGLFRVRGAATYGGEDVSQLDHALQCAQLAEEEGATPELVAASLLHDLGHLLVEGLPGPRDGNDLHQYHPLPFLRSVFPDEVLEPIRLHVEAKRYLCHADPGYLNALSPASQRSLVMRGGPHNPLEAKSFLAASHAEDALRLRRWDDRAKAPRKRTPPLKHYARVLEDCACHAYAPGSRWA